MIEGQPVEALVEIGHRNGEWAEATAGLSVGDAVILHPSDRVSDGTRVGRRENGS